MKVSVRVIARFTAVGLLFLVSAIPNQGGPPISVGVERLTRGDLQIVRTRATKAGVPFIRISHDIVSDRKSGTLTLEAFDYNDLATVELRDGTGELGFTIELLKRGPVNIFRETYNIDEFLQGKDTTRLTLIASTRNVAGAVESVETKIILK